MRKAPILEPRRQLNVMVSDAMFIEVAEYAIRQRMTRTDVVIEALRQYLARQGRRTVPCEAAS